MYGAGWRFQERNRFNSTHRETQLDTKSRLFTLVKSPDLIFSLEEINKEAADKTGVEEEVAEEDGARGAAEFAGPEMLGVPLFLPVRHDGR